MATKKPPKTQPSSEALLVSLGNKPRRGSIYTCEDCSVKFYAPPSRAPRYCSRPCARKGLYKSQPKKCSTCNKEYRTPMSQERHRGKSRFCSKQCKGASMSLSQIGNKNPLWRGGVSQVNRRLRSSKKFKVWRESVVNRDNFICQSCSKRGGYLEPHHIRPFAYFPELRFEISNGITLCRQCHKRTDTWGQKARTKYENQAIPG